MTLTDEEWEGLREALRFHRKNCLAGKDCGVPSSIYDEDKAIRKLRLEGMSDFVRSQIRYGTELLEEGMGKFNALAGTLFRLVADEKEEQ